MKWMLCVLVLFSHTVTGQERGEDSLKSVVVDFFEGLSTADLRKMRECVTDDFMLLEHGQIWNMDTLAARLSGPRPEGYHRENGFEFIREESNGNTAFVSYFNTARITTMKTKRTVKWLETTVLVRSRGAWKMKLMHSTRLEP